MWIFPFFLFFFLSKYLSNRMRPDKNSIIYYESLKYLLHVLFRCQVRLKNLLPVLIDLRFYVCFKNSFDSEDQ